jgi:hypothetical protein
VFQIITTSRPIGDCFTTSNNTPSFPQSTLPVYAQVFNIDV